MRRLQQSQRIPVQQLSVRRSAGDTAAVPFVQPDTGFYNMQWHASTQQPARLRHATVCACVKLNNGPLAIVPVIGH